MHALGEILAQWAGLAQPEWKVPGLVELREMDGEKRQISVFVQPRRECGRSGVRTDIEAAGGERPGICARRNAESRGKSIHREDGSSAAGSADLPD